MSDKRLHLGIPLPSEEYRRLFEEWLINKKKDEQAEEEKEERVVVIDI